MNQRLVSALHHLQRSLKHPAFEFVGAAIGLVLLVWVLRTALRDVSALSFTPAYAVLSVAVFGVAWWGLAVCWSLLLDGRAGQAAMSRWFRTQLFRYIPGGIWAPIARVADPARQGRDVAKKVGIETVAILCSGALVGALVATFALSAWWGLLGLASAGGLGLSYALARQSGLTPGAARLWVVCFVGSMASYMIGSVCAQRAVSESVPLGPAAAAGLLSWVAGFVVVIAPGGLGAKEWAYVGLLSAVPESTAAAGAVAARVCFLIAELGTLLFVAALASRGTPPSTGES